MLPSDAVAVVTVQSSGCDHIIGFADQRNRVLSRVSGFRDGFLFPPARLSALPEGSVRLISR